MRESFIVQGARLFIPCHSIPLHRIPSSDRKRRDNDETRYIYYTYYTLLSSFLSLFSFSLYNFFFYRYFLDRLSISLFYFHECCFFFPPHKYLRRGLARSHFDRRQSSHLIHVSRLRFRYISQRIRSFFFFLSFFSWREVQPVKRPNIEHRKLVCVLMPRADRYMSQGEMSQGRSVSKAPKVTVWNIQSLCEHCAFAVSGSCVRVTERRVPDG